MYKHVQTMMKLHVVVNKCAFFQVYAIHIIMFCFDELESCMSLLFFYLQEHLARIVLLSNVGYGISLISLLVAVGIMVYFK